MIYGVLDYDDSRSVGAQCQLCYKHKELECSDEYGPGLRLFYRSDTETIDDYLESWSSKTVSTLKREEYSSRDHEEEMVDNMIENWWNGSFSIPAPCSYKAAKEARIRNEEQSREQSTKRIVHAEEVGYEDLFKRLMNVNIYAVAEYMSNDEPFCFNEHIINALILCTTIAALYLIF